MISEKTIKRFDDLNVISMYDEGKTFAEISKMLKTGYNQLHQYFIIKGKIARRAIRRKTIRNKAPKGEKFGLWTVVSEEVKSGREVNSNNNDRNLYWLVQCKCGHLAWKSPVHLKDGTSTRCKKCGNKSFITREGEVELQALLISKFKQIQEGLKTRKKVQNLEFNITPEYLNELYTANKYCALSGIDLSLDLNKRLQQQNLSVDRIDSNLGYVVGNIQLVDKRINMMKGTLSNDEFIELCCKVAENNGYSRCE